MATVLLPSIILLEDDISESQNSNNQVLLPSIILLEDDYPRHTSSAIQVLLPSIILLEDDQYLTELKVNEGFATIYYFARR